MTANILIVEDEVNIARILSLELRHEGYHAEIAESGKIGFEKAMRGGWDLILLDIMLPEWNGLEVLRRLRNSEVETPVILLTARDTTPDKVSGLDLGANDYVTKPFEIEELLARIRANMRHPRTVESAEHADTTIEYTLRDLHVNTKTREVSRSGRSIELTPKEFDLLVYLMERHGEAVSREDIVSSVWRYDYMGDTNIVDVYIGYLRKKVDHGFGANLIQTVRGVGYSLRDKSE